MGLIKRGCIAVSKLMSRLRDWAVKCQTTLYSTKSEVINQTRKQGRGQKSPKDIRRRIWMVPKIRPMPRETQRRNGSVSPVMTS